MIGVFATEFDVVNIIVMDQRKAKNKEKKEHSQDRPLSPHPNKEKQQQNLPCQEGSHLFNMKEI